MEMKLDRVDVPSLSDLFFGEIEDTWQRDAKRCLINCLDPSVPTEGNRTLSFSIDFQAEADLSSTVMSCKGMAITTVSAQPPKPARLIFAVRNNEVTAEHHNTGPRVGIPQLEEPGKVPGLDKLSELCGGQVDLAWKVELCKILQNLQDPRCDPKVKRSIKFKIVFKVDSDRAVFRIRAAEIRAKTAPLRDIPESVLYMSRSQEKPRLNKEPEADLPDGKVGVQERIN